MKLEGRDDMNNIIDYVTWRGDLAFEDAPLNNLDCLIFATISYFPIERVVKNEREVLTICELYQRMIDKKLKVTDFLLSSDVTLLQLLANSNRFKDLKISNFVCKMSFALEQQFCALTIPLPGHQLFVSYRGTDHSFVGWKEDFNMTYMDVVPSQEEALHYLNHLKTSLFTKIYIGGHSKGGNLSVYAAMNCSSKIQHKIKKVFNYDGPGFLKDVTEREEYKRIASRISTYIPQTSIIGRLLNCNDGYLVIKSNQKLVLQHDFYSWEIYPTDFVYFDDVDENSHRFNEILSEWLETVPFEEREQFINLIYKLLLKTNAMTFEELDLKGFQGLKKIYTLLETIDKEERKVIDRVMKKFLKVVKSNVLSNKKKVEEK